MRRAYCSLLAVAITSAVLLLFAVLQQPVIEAQDQDVDVLRARAAEAIKELRYRDALELLQRIEDSGAATFDDRDSLLTCLLRLREPGQFVSRLQGYIDTELDPLIRGRFIVRLIDHLNVNNRWQNRERLRELFPRAISLLAHDKPTGEKAEHWADAVFSYVDFLRWDNNRSATVKIVGLLQQVAAAGVDNERSGKAELWIAGEYDRFVRIHEKSEEEIVAAYRMVVERYPDSAAAPSARLTLGGRFEGQSEYVLALSEFDGLVKRWPKSTEAVQAAARAAEIRRPRLEMFVEEVFKPGAEAFISIRYRNITSIDFTAYRFDLLSHLREVKTLDRIQSAVDISSADPAASWTYKTEDRGRHQWHSTKVTMPESNPGAFIVSASGGNVVNRALLLISGLATVVKTTADDTLVYCADAVSGDPVSGADLLIATDYRYDRTILDRFIPYDQRRYYFHALGEGRTDDSGIWNGEVQSGESSGELLVLARKGNDFALSQSYLGYWYRHGAETRIYVYTDRPVYRPEQTVHFKAIVRVAEDGIYHNRPGQPVQVVIEDPRGNTVKTENLETNEFGAVSGSLQLEESPPLGYWRLTLNFGGERTYSGFRVEEYKKPEFKVTVTPGESQYRLGSRLEATIGADYYFGEPVAGAKVEYEVRQNQSWWWYRPSGSYAWLYGEEDFPRYYYGGGRIVLKGSGTTDADGRLNISVPTAVLPRDEREIKVYDFTISATVTDASRREIRGAGSTKVASTEFNASLQADRYVYKPGNEVEVSLYTARHDGTALATTGNLVLYRATWNKEKGEYDLEEVWSREASTDDKGNGTAAFAAEEEGYFRLRYETSGAYDNSIIGETSVWVSGEYFHSQFFDNDGLKIIPDKDHYLLGDTARILINSQLDGVHALLTVEAERIVQHRLLVLRQGANMIELPVGEAFEPNVFVKVHAVRDFALYSDSQRLLVPPEEKFAAVVIEPSKKSYAPGEKGEITVRASDWKGNPLDAEFSIGVVDASLYYIAEDTTQDIRAFFFGRLRGDSVRTSSSFEFSFVGREDEMKLAARSAAEPSAMAEEVEDASAQTGAEEDLVEPEVRKDFRDSALWLAHVRTGEDGVATVEVQWPDNLTAWRTTVRAVTPATVVGSAVGEVITRKDLLIRLQTPRFLVQGDRVTLSVNVHNYLEEAKRVKVSLETGELELVGPAERWIELGAGEEQRFDVEAVAGEPGEATVLAKALTDEESDAMQLTLPVYVHGMEKFASAAGTVIDERTIELNLPEAIKAGSAKLRLQVRPTIAGAMLDSLPYLIQYPYGCTEQTMSRFLPAAIVAKTLRDLGLERPELEKELPKVIQAGLERLYDFQHSDGGWGWWKHDSSQAYMSAYVVYGLAVAMQAGIAIDENVLRRGVQFLRRELPKLENKVELLNFVIFALSWGDNVPQPYLNRIYDLLPKMRAYETALFAVTLDNIGRGERFDAVMEQLRQRADLDSEQGIVSWGKPGGWYWYQDNVEATALALMALLRHDPDNELVPGTVRWLLSVRKGGKWKSTRDTAFAIYALTDFIKTTDEFNPELTAEIEVDGRVVKTVTFTRDNLFSDDGVIELSADELKPGTQSLRIVKSGRGNLYFDAFLSYFSLEERLTAASTTVAVNRTYFKLHRSVDGQGKEVVSRTQLREGDPLRSGDEIEVRLELSSQNNYEYLVYEDFKPAGCEPLRLRSGYTYGSIASNLELRDEKVVFFIGWLPKGSHIVTYELRAEIPGTFHALPTNGYAMYAPDVRAISDEFVMKIKD